MNTQQLLCFLQVAEKLNFTRAGEALFLSTPTVTHHIQSLEEELQAKLFIRSRKSVQLSEAGMIFYNDARDIIARFDAAKHHVEKMDKQRKAIIRIGLSNQNELHNLTSILRQFQHDYPDAFPHIIVTNYSQLLNLLNDRQLDIVFGTRDIMQNVHAYTFKTLRTAYSMAVLSRQHPLADRALLSFDDLRDVRLIILHSKMIPFKAGSYIQERIRSHGSQHLDMICENDQTCITMAIANYGVAILPEFCIPDDLDSTTFVKIPLQDTDVMEYGIAYPTNRRDVELNHFIRLCRS